MRGRHREWLDDWETTAARSVTGWHELTDAERDRLGSSIEWLVRSKHWEAADGFDLSAEIVVTVAANASLLLLGLDRSVYRHVKAIVVHPRTFTQCQPRPSSVRGLMTTSPVHLAGQAHGLTGPVLLSWSAIGRGRRQRSNVTVHEFAHKIDAADGLFDGTPEFADRGVRSEWIATCQSEFRRLRRHRGPDPVLSRYGATNPSEFFAVATEAFIEQPVELAHHRPRLYGVLRDYFDQDPATRMPPSDS